MQSAMVDQARTIDDVACEPAWSVDATCALEGSVRGLLVRKWAENLRRRFGPNPRALPDPSRE